MPGRPVRAEESVSTIVGGESGGHGAPPPYPRGAIARGAPSPPAVEPAPASQLTRPTSASADRVDHPHFSDKISDLQLVVSRAELCYRWVHDFINHTPEDNEMTIFEGIMRTNGRGDGLVTVECCGEIVQFGHRREFAVDKVLHQMAGKLIEERLAMQKTATQG